MIKLKEFVRKIYLICPVTNAGYEDKVRLNAIVERLEESGYEVYYPGRDTDQDADIVEINKQNKTAILDSHACLVYFKESSRGTLYDIGFADALHKPMCLIHENSHALHKPYLRYLEKISDPTLARDMINAGVMSEVDIPMNGEHDERN